MGRQYIPGEMVKVSALSRYPKYLHPLSPATVERMCRQGIFKTATKLGAGKRAHWFVSATEVLSWKIKRNALLLTD